MALDSADYVNELDDTIPAAGAFVYEGDDHIRRIKTTLLQTFPNLDGAIGAEPADLPKGNKVATGAPTVNDDSGDGYSIGSIWIDVTNDAGYICVDDTVGAAVWVALGGVASGAKQMFFQSDTSIMTGWTFQALDEDYVVRPGGTNSDGGTTSGTPDNTGWAISGASMAHTHTIAHSHDAGSLQVTITAVGRGGGGLNTGESKIYNVTGTTAGSSAANSGAASTSTVSFTGAWRPPTLFGTVWEKD